MLHHSCKSAHRHLALKSWLSLEEQRIKKVNVANSYIELLQKLHASLGIPKEYLEQCNQSLLLSAK